ncbi:MAG: type II toxin-antitoxin system VapC family toxin [Anaerolineae bacterium]
MRRIVTIDANLAVSLVVPTPYSTIAAMQMARWWKEGWGIFAPALWGYEVVSALRKAVAAKTISAQEADIGLEKVLGFKVLQVTPTPELHHSALQWAARLGQRVAYDASYLALAESLSCEFWTADERLVNAARRAGVTWAHWLQDTPVC